MDITKEVVLTYFNAWQNKEWDKMRSCLSEGFKVDGGQVNFPSIDTFIAFCQAGPSWSQIVLLDSIFQGNKAALLYEGLTSTGQKIRVSEFLQIDQNKITHSKIAISLA